MATSHRRKFGMAALLIVVTVLAYLPALRGGFIWDDDSFLTRNELIQSADGLGRIWFSTEPADYWPVTSTALWLEWRFWGPHPFGYHAVNLALYAASVVLLWRVLVRLKLPGAAAAALLFSLHPVNVESVAWIAEIKNLLALLFFLLSIRFFLDERKALSLGCGVLGMLSKGSVAILPVVLLGLVAWKRRPSRRDLLGLAPYFAAGILFAALNVWFQGHHLTEAIRQAGAGDRLAGAGAVVWFYLTKAILPIRLLFVYPAWPIGVARSAMWLPLLAGIALTLYLWRAWRAGFFAWGYFCLCLVPVMGFADVYFMKFSPVADRYQQLALIAPTAAAAWYLARRAPRFPVAAVAALCLFAPLTWARCRLFRDSDTLFQATLARNPGCWLAHVNLGFSRLEQGNDREARNHFLAALALNPASAEAHCDLGITLLHDGRHREAADEFAEALRLIPTYPQAENGLGLACLDLGRIPEAALHLERALRLRPQYAEARNNLGLVMVNLGRLPDAIAQFEEAVRIRPDYANARNNLAAARALSASGAPPAAAP